MLLQSLIRTFFIETAMEIFSQKAVRNLCIPSLAEDEGFPSTGYELVRQVRSGEFYENFWVLVNIEDVVDGITHLGFEETMSFLKERSEVAFSRGIPEL